jgi:Cu+-exporting ATPase
VISGVGPGYFDSLTGLVFFLLIGKYFQQKTYNYLSFERDYRSYFPIAVTRIKEGREESIPVQEVKKGERLLIRHQELIPVDGILIRGEAELDYSFVTGESTPVHKSNGEKVYAGAKQLGSAIEIDVINTISESYLTELWSNDTFQNQEEHNIKTLTDNISKRFTIIIISIALIAGLYWMWEGEPGTAAEVVTAVLIIACPCALALAAPFAMGNMLRIFGYRKFYLKNAEIIEKMSHVNHIIFDKTGTLTLNDASHMEYTGDPLSEEEMKA